MPVKVAVIGCGYWGKHHLHILNDLHVLHAACDIDEDRRRWVEDTYRINVYSDSLELYNHEALDAVTICTPHNQLAKETLKALAHGVHVFVEKPMALNSQDAWHIWAASWATGNLVMPGLIELFNPKIRGFEFHPCLQFTRKNPFHEGRDLIWDTIVHDIGLAFHLQPKWCLFNVGWTSGVKLRTINGKSIMCEGSLDRELLHFAECVKGNETPRATAKDGVRVVEIAEQIRRLSTN